MFGLKLSEIFLIAIAGAAVMFTSPSWADTVTGDYETQSDNEGLTTHRYLVGYRDLYGKWVLGAKIGSFDVSDNNGSYSFDEFRFTFYRNFNNKTSMWGYLGYLDSSDWSLPTGDIGVGHTFSPRVYGELSATKNTFDTFQTQVTRTSYTSYTGRLEYEWTYNIDLTGIYTFGDTSDGNDFNAYEGHIDYNAPIIKGLQLKYQHRYKGYDHNSPGIFTPNDWRRNLFGVGYERKYDSQWKVKAHLLTGPQDVDSQSGQFTELKTFIQFKPSSRTTWKLVHDRVVSEVNGYNYKWNWTGIHFQHNF